MVHRILLGNNGSKLSSESLWLKASKPGTHSLVLAFSLCGQKDSLGSYELVTELAVGLRSQVDHLVVLGLYNSLSLCGEGLSKLRNVDCSSTAVRSVEVEYIYYPESDKS